DMSWGPETSRFSSPWRSMIRRGRSLATVEYVQAAIRSERLRHTYAASTPLNRRSDEYEKYQHDGRRHRRNQSGRWCARVERLTARRNVRHGGRAEFAAWFRALDLRGRRHFRVHQAGSTGSLQNRRVARDANGKCETAAPAGNIPR